LLHLENVSDAILALHIKIVAMQKAAMLIMYKRKVGKKQVDAQAQKSSCLTLTAQPMIWLCQEGTQDPEINRAM
jgi:hypothetical protein